MEKEEKRRQSASARSVKNDKKTRTTRISTASHILTADAVEEAATFAGDVGGASAAGSPIRQVVKASGTVSPLDTLPLLCSPVVLPHPTPSLVTQTEVKATLLVCSTKVSGLVQAKRTSNAARGVGETYLLRVMLGRRTLTSLSQGYEYGYWQSPTRLRRG